MRGGELGAGDLVPLELLDRVDRRQRGDAVAAAGPVLHDHRLGLLALLGEDRGLAGPVVDRVPHDVHVPLAEGRQLGRRVFQEDELDVEPVLLLVAGAPVGVHAVVEHDAGRVAGPGVDGHHQRAAELAAVAQVGHRGDPFRALVALRIGRSVAQGVEIVLAHGLVLGRGAGAAFPSERPDLEVRSEPADGEERRDQQSQYHDHLPQGGELHVLSPL